MKTTGLSLPAIPQSCERCPHCGGLHFGQRFDDCVYVKLLDDPNATVEERANAQRWLDLETRDRAARMLAKQTSE